MLQGFVVPQLENFPIKFGFGPQVSLRSRTDESVGRTGWGAGAAAVAYGFAGNLSYGAIFGHRWGQDSFSLSTIQPIVFYNTDLLDWSGKAGDRWQMPVGLAVGKTLALDGSYAVDVNLGGIA